MSSEYPRRVHRPMRPLSLWGFRPTTFGGSDATTLSTFIAQTGGPDIRNRVHVARYFPGLYVQNAGEQNHFVRFF